MMFFDPDTWRGKEIIFPGDSEVIWVLDQKLGEKFRHKTKEHSTAPNGPSVLGQYSHATEKIVEWKSTQLKSGCSKLRYPLILTEDTKITHVPV
jgi:hypothetical protein